jgi:hypothetical protein
MYTYYFLFSLLFILVNFGYAFGQLGRGSKHVFSVPLLIVSAVVCIGSLVLIRRRIRLQNAQASAAKSAEKVNPTSQP